ncbi:uncharacterized protein (UPF0548 family) [Brevibacterium sanguinis]|uniref:Uncharacterized protein (UPF0548 family) n=2 Tax=Brevibacterium TaxID=1696 RepID=A0A366IIX2_9MICO|nr:MULTISPECIES: DUF1990 family protein [Brevibacterium]RBP62208.1 uncharacterized protein (UPF0548 family) [Brevibacterium sanguinis]RBP70660.1 uncharacterized protein (UPF0548 family) [Brevibacterium celere]
MTCPNSLRQGSEGNHLSCTLDLGAADLFPAAREAVLTWELHEAAGVLIRPRRRVDVGRRVELRLDALWPLPPRRRRVLTVPVGGCEITEVVDTATCAGFTYRTLPGHLVSGEETFLVSIGTDGRLGVTITSTSVPEPAPLRTVAPLVVAGQQHMARRYAQGLRRILKRVRSVPARPAEPDRSLPSVASGE